MKQPGRLTRFQQSLPAQAAIVTSNLNRYYLSGFLGTAGTLLVTKDKVFYLADGRYFEAVSQKVPFAKAVLVKSKGWDELAALCAELGIGQLAFEALEESVLYSVDIDTVMELLRKSHEVLMLENRLLRESLQLHWEREMLLAQCSAAERYQAFLKKFPGLIDRINHKMVASFLGITPVQLSRVRHSLKNDGNLHKPDENIASIIEPLFTVKL